MCVCVCECMCVCVCVCVLDRAEKILGRKLHETTSYQLLKTFWNN